LQGGAGFFRGLSVDGSALGKTVAEVFRKVFDKFVPDLYSKLEMGAKPLKEHSAEDVLKAANLSGLSTVFYEGADGYGLVIQEGNKYLPNRDAPVAKEIMAYIRERASYGEKVSGKDLEQRFCGLNYGWERDLIQTVLAVLLRAGAIEVTYQGRRFKNHMEAAARVPFTTTTAFRNASYAPRETIALKTLTTAAERYEEITGQEVDCRGKCYCPGVQEGCRAGTDGLAAGTGQGSSERPSIQRRSRRLPINAEPNCKQRDRRLRKDAGGRGSLAKAKYRTRPDHTGEFDRQQSFGAAPGESRDRTALALD